MAVLGQGDGCAFELPVDWALFSDLLIPIGSLVGDFYDSEPPPPSAFLMLVLCRKHFLFIFVFAKASF